MAGRRKTLVALGTLALAAAAVGAALAGHWCYCTRPGCLPGVPARDYRYRQRSASVLALSESPVEMKGRAGISGDRLRLFQWGQPDPTVDHCELTRVALQFYPNGDWILSLRAHQNRRLEADEKDAPEEEGPILSPTVAETTLTPEDSEEITQQLKRNQFSVKLRCYGAYEVAGNETDQAISKPVLLTIKPPDFWVQRAEPYDRVFKGHDPEVAQFFERVDRVELEFFYYK